MVTPLELIRKKRAQARNVLWMTLTGLQIDLLSQGSIIGSVDVYIHRFIVLTVIIQFFIIILFVYAMYARDHLQRVNREVLNERNERLKAIEDYLQGIRADSEKHGADWGTQHVKRIV